MGGSRNRINHGSNSSEAIPGTRPRYSPDEEMAYDLSGVMIFQQDTSPWLVAAGAKYTFYGDEVDDSPITSDDSELSLFFGVGYTIR